MKKAIALLLVAIMTLFMFTACNDDEDNVPTRVPGNNLVSPDVNLNNNPDLNLNNSWSDNYYAMFTYYCPAQGYSTATVISERKTANCFIISNPMDASFKYYVNSDIGLDEYAVNPEKNLFKYTSHQGKIVSRDINTMFENISAVTENFTKGPDIVYTGTETVADRNCWMYLQRTYTESGEVDKVAYLWIDAVYGFCSKCITYSGGDVVLSWELQDFSVGNVKDADITPDLTAYNFTQN
ncbi:MAG: hypothetical protein IJA31_08795 [Clostridia bacterium]|nr:hypothetical protein [Clostridia bacterium]